MKPNLIQKVFKRCSVPNNLDRMKHNFLLIIRVIVMVRCIKI